MKKVKILIINIILLSLINVLPKEKILDTVQVSVQVSEQVEKNFQISSRGGELRQAPTEMSQLVTTYSEDLYEYIKSKESFKAEAYLLEGEKYCTIGYGHHGSDVKPGQVVSEEEADRILRADLKGISDFVLKYCSYFEITQNQLDALTSFTYNGGPEMLQQLTANKTRSPEEIVEHIEFYTKSSSETFGKGLKNRRLEEKEIFLGGFKNEETQIEY